MKSARPRLGVFKFASCDGCQLSLLAAEDELLHVADMVHIAYFLEATSRIEPGPYDVALVEGSITTAEDAERIQQVRRESHYLITIGACATAGGIQALRNWGDCDEMVAAVYPTPQFISTLAKSTPISDHVKVDFELRGCPINQYQLIEVIQALVNGRRPRTPTHSVCLECKRAGVVCVSVARGVPCLGPVTQAGCGALCPSFQRGCYGCFGPAHQPNLVSLSENGDFEQTPRELHDRLRSFNCWSKPFRDESERLSRIRPATDEANHD